MYKDEIVAALPESHRLARETVPLGALVHEKFILYQREGWPGLFDTIIGLCRKAGFSPQITNSALIQTVLTLVSAGEGVSLVPASVRHYRPQGVVFRSLKPEGPHVNLVMAWRSENESTAQTAFLDVVRASKPEILRAIHASF